MKSLSVLSQKKPPLFLRWLYKKLEPLIVALSALGLIGGLIYMILFISWVAYCVTDADIEHPLIWSLTELRIFAATAAVLGGIVVYWSGYALRRLWLDWKKYKVNHS